MPSSGNEPAGGAGILESLLQVGLADGGVIFFELVMIGLSEGRFVEFPPWTLELKSGSEFANIVRGNKSVPTLGKDQLQ